MKFQASGAYPVSVSGGSICPPLTVGLSLVILDTHLMPLFWQGLPRRTPDRGYWQFSGRLAAGVINLAIPCQGETGEPKGWLSIRECRQTRPQAQGLPRSPPGL